MIDKEIISIIVPCRNEIDNINFCLQSILGQKLSMGVLEEIIVADGMSDDGTREIITRMAEKDHRIKLIENQNKIRSSGLNEAIMQSKGDIIVAMDAHSIYPPNYLEHAVNALMKSGADVAGGVVVNQVKNSTVVSRAIALLTNHKFGVGNSPARTAKKGRFADSVAFGAFHRCVFEKFGLFDERLVRTADTEFWNRITKNGGKIYLDPSIRILYYNQSNFSGFMRQAIWTGLWNAFTIRLYPGSMRLRHLIPSLFILYCLGILLMILAGLALGLNWLLFAGLILFAPYFCLDLLASISLTPGHPGVPGGFGLFPVLFCLFPSYHFSYGLGTWLGLWRIINGSWLHFLGSPLDRYVDFLQPKN